MRTRLRPLPLAVASAVVLAVGIGAWSPASQADTTPAACTTVGPSLTDFTATLTLPKFDPTLGTLTAVTISGSTTMRAQIRVENTSATADTVGAAISFNSSLGLPGGRSVPTELAYSHTESVPAFDGVLDYAGSGFDTGPVETSEELPTLTLTGTDVGPYLGPGTFDSTFNAVGRTQGFGSGNQVNRIIVEAAATVCVAYSYSVATTTTTMPTTSTTAPPSSTTTVAPTSSTSTSTSTSTTPRSTTTVAPTTSTTTSTTSPCDSLPTTTVAGSSTTVPAWCAPVSTTTTTAVPRTTTTVRPAPDTAVPLPAPSSTSLVRAPAVPAVAVASPSTTRLPRTGSEPLRLVLIGAGLLGTGASLVLWRRGQRTAGAA